jgi:hypothetical protein
MAAVENPFAILFSALHCISDRYCVEIGQGKWKDAICFYFISDSSSGQGANISHSQVPPDGETDVSGMKTPT